jgi:uncharacterized protein (TIGR02145 family)
MQIIPVASTPVDGGCSYSQNSFSYSQTENGNSYTISFCLGNTTGTLTAGPKCLTPGGIMDLDCSCGDSFVDSRDGKSYTTVKIGSQCWMKENLGYLPSVSPAAAGDTSSPYYYVYNYDGIDVSEAKAESSYITYGALYNHLAALTACPAGWHLPSFDDFAVLIRRFTTDPNCDPYYSGCPPAGANLLVGGSSNFDLTFAGFRSPAGEFSAQDGATLAWSSLTSPDNPAVAWYLEIDDGDPNAIPGMGGKDYGNSIRCIKN